MPVEHSLPLQRSLFIVTPSAIHLRSQTGSKLLFECGNAGGIVTARAPTNNSIVLAVADSQVVVLHDTTREREKKLRLKAGDARPRLLQFSPDSRTLFFTTTLNTSVQAYSLPTGDLLPSSISHPSPPNVVALSQNGHVLLSASPSPPTILLSDRRWGGSALVSLQPTDTPSAAKCAAFQAFDSSLHPSSTNLVLGFQDGALVMYQLSLPSLSHLYKSPPVEQSQSHQLRPTRVGAMKRLHKGSMGGITAAAFIPGYASRVVSIGYDGRCRLVEFEGGGRILRTWHVSGPATSLSVTASGSIASRDRKDGAVLFGGDATNDQEAVYNGIGIFIAIGTQAGTISIFNTLGLLVQEIIMSVPVISVEWVGDMSGTSTLLNRSPLLFPEPGPVIQSLMEQVGDFGVLQLPNTVKEADTSQAPSSHSVAKHQIVSFSNEVDQTDVITDNLPHVSSVALLQVPRTRQSPRTNLFTRSRLETADFSLTASSLKPPIPTRSSLQTDAPVEKAHKWLQIRKAPMVTPHRARRFLASHASSHLSRSSLSSEQDYFTPPPTRHPSTRKDKGKEKATEKDDNLAASAAGKSLVFQADSESDDPAPSMEQPLQIERSAGSINPGTVRGSQTLAAANNKPLYVVLPGLPGGQPVHSSTARSRPDIQKSTSRSGKRKYVDTPPTEASSVHDFSSSLYSRPNSRVFRSHSKAMDGGADAINPLLQDRVCTPRKSFSFDNGLQVLEVPAEQEYSAVRGAGVWSGGVCEEISRLRNDYTALNKQMSDLRGEFRTLKDVLLQAESDRRWREIECSS